MTTTPAQPPKKMQCSRPVSHVGVWTLSPCSMPATKNENGKSYCTIHAPSYVAAKKAAFDIKFQERLAAERPEQADEQAAKVEQARRAACYPALLESLEQAVVATENYNRGDRWDYDWLEAARDVLAKAKDMKETE